MKYIFWSLEIFLASLSFLFYKITKLIIGNLFTIYLALNRKQASQWRVLSQKTLESPLVLPVLMTKGPRWNTHAIIGTLGPFKIQQEITLDIESANNSAASWIAVVYSFPSYKTITSIESEKLNFDSKWHQIKLPSGSYSLGLRYYNVRDEIVLPTVKIDNQEFVSQVAVPSDINNFYHDLIKAKNWFYLSLHYYIYPILKLRNYLPESFVKREYLPVGAPDTFFVYNYLEKDQALQIDFTPKIINNYNIYFTLYDRSSLPLSWCQITTFNYQLPAPQTNSYYLLRIRLKPKSSDNNLTLDWHIKTETNTSQKLIVNHSGSQVDEVQS
jgi:hypothetical protein